MEDIQTIIANVERDEESSPIYNVGTSVARRIIAALNAADYVIAPKKCHVQCAKN